MVPHEHFLADSLSYELQATIVNDSVEKDMAAHLG